MGIVVRVTMELREGNSVQLVRQEERVFNKEFFAERAFKTALYGLTKNVKDDAYVKKVEGK